MKHIHHQFKSHLQVPSTVIQDKPESQKFPQSYAFAPSPHISIYPTYCPIQSRNRLRSNTLISNW